MCVLVLCKMFGFSGQIWSVAVGDKLLLPTAEKATGSSKKAAGCTAVIVSFIRAVVCLFVSDLFVCAYFYCGRHRVRFVTNTPDALYSQLIQCIA